jgi:hypothetical protein
MELNAAESNDKIAIPEPGGHSVYISSADPARIVALQAQVEAMKKKILQYNIMIEAALRAVVRQALNEVSEHGLPGDHHFYITFRTAYPGVELPDYLRARYPAEMTIVLQYQFDDLKVDEQNLGVTLTFNNTPTRLIIPLAAITVFADPSVNFALPFQPSEAPEPAPPPEAVKAPEPTASPSDAKTGDGKTGEVVSLDKFRKK